MTDDWTPDQPLRADASDNHISERLARFCNHPGGWRFPNYDDCTRVARELQAATKAESDAERQKMISYIEDQCFAINGDDLQWVDAINVLVESYHGEAGRRITAEGMVSRVIAGYEAKLAALINDERLLHWLNAQVLKDAGRVEFITMEHGDVGLLLFGRLKASGVGSTVKYAIMSAMQREAADAARTPSPEPTNDR